MSKEKPTIHPVQAVLDAPVGTHDVGEPHRGEVTTEEIVCDPVAGRTVGLPPRRDLTYGGQARPLMLLLQPVDGGAGDEPCQGALTARIRRSCCREAGARTSNIACSGIRSESSSAAARR